MDTIGQRLQKLMLEKKISQTQLADAINSNQSTISRWIDDKPSPSKTSIKKIAAVTGCSVDWLQYGKGPQTITQQQNKSVIAKNGSIAVGNNIAGNVTQGDKQFRNPDVLTLARLLDEFESPAAIKVMIKKYEKLRKEMDL